MRPDMAIRKTDTQMYSSFIPLLSESPSVSSMRALAWLRSSSMRCGSERQGLGPGAAAAGSGAGRTLARLQLSQGRLCARAWMQDVGLACTRALVLGRSPRPARPSSPAAATAWRRGAWPGPPCRLDVASSKLMSELLIPDFKGSQGVSHGRITLLQQRG